jgi:glycosyltransferase involved in cell wall biosynthesis
MLDAEFTVIICTRNRLEVLRDTVELVLLRLSTYSNALLVVVDNDSKDGTAEYLHELTAKTDRVIATREPRPGLYHARKHGIGCARGEFFIIIDDDIVPGDNWPGALLAELVKDPRVGAVGAAVDPIWEGGRPAWVTDRIARNAFGGSDRTKCRFPRYPYGCCTAFRNCAFLSLYAAAERQIVELGWGARSSPGGPVGGEDWDLAELFIRNRFAVITVDHVRVGHRVFESKVGITDVLQKFQADGRLHIRYARLARYPVFSKRILIYIAAFPVLSVLDYVIGVSGVQRRECVAIQSYSRRARGIWQELILGVRGIRFPFHLDE